MSVVYAPKSGNNLLGILGTLATTFIPGLQPFAPFIGAGINAMQGNWGGVATSLAGGLPKGAVSSPQPSGTQSTGIAGTPSPVTSGSSGIGGATASGQTSLSNNPSLAPDATDRMQMNKVLMNDQSNQRKQLDSRFNEILGQYNITPEGNVDQSKWDGLMRSYPSIFGYQRGR